jgi:predicted RNase H-like HicB family nuclease
MTFDPESYTISIRKENHDGDILYVGRVAEFPNISSFEDSFDEARSLVIDAIQTLKKIADEAQTDFPIPFPFQSDEFSGRVTLRLPKTLHAKVSRKADQEGISVNQYLVTAVATYVGETDGIAKVVSEATSLLGHIVNHAVTNLDTTVVSWKAVNFLQGRGGGDLSQSLGREEQ